MRTRPATFGAVTPVTLGFGLVEDPETVARMVDRLAFLVESRDGSLTTGFLGTPLVCPALTRFGRTDLAYRIFRRRVSIPPRRGYALLALRGVSEFRGNEGADSNMSFDVASAMPRISRPSASRDTAQYQ